MKIVTWNVNGLRAVLNKGFGVAVEAMRPDILCLQEIKTRPEQVTLDLPGWHVFWNPAQRPGYSGTAILTRPVPLGVTTGIGEPAADAEGRVITAEFPAFFVVNAYVPNVGRGLARLPYRIGVWGPAFRGHLKRLERSKPVIFCGDMNVAHKEIDLARPKQNVGNAGFTDEERKDFDEILACGYRDSFREICTAGGHYTWWSYQAQARARNIGWRIDCVGISNKLGLKEAFILPAHAGSDHCPAGAVVG